MNKRIFIYILLIVLNAGCVNAKEDKRYQELIENYPIEIMWGALLHEWSKSYKDVETLIVKPPYLQIIYQHSVDDYLVERIYDYSKKGLVRENHYTNLKEYFNIRFKTNVSIMREFDIQPFDNSYSNKNMMKTEIPKDFLPYVDLNQIYSKPILFNLQKVKIYIAGNDTLRGNYQEPLRNHYFQFFIRTKKGVIAIKKWIEPKKLNLDFPSQINNPLNGKDVYFLIVDIDGNGIEELITAACGPEHHRNYFYYNIFDFTKLVRYLEKNKLLEKK